MLCVCSGAWAADVETTTATLNNWTVNTGTGGTVTWDSNNTVAVINCGGTKGNAVTLTSDISYSEISKIEFTTYVSDRSKTELKIEIGTITDGVFTASQTFSSSYDTDAKKLSLGTLSITKNSVNASGAVEPSPAATGYVRLTMANASGSTNKTGKYFNVKITAKPKTLTSATLTGIKINGNSWDIAGLSDNKATITTDYSGAPTVQFVYTAGYDDGTSETGKIEEVVAVRNEGSYKATSTVFTNNVTLTFTNVSNVLFSMTDPTGPTEALEPKSNPVSVEATFGPGCSAMVYNGHSTNAAQLVYANAINLNGSGGSYFKANFTAALAEGDVITSSNTNESIFKLNISNTSSGATVVTFPYTIPAGSNLIGKKAVFVFKNTTPATFESFTITRSRTVDSEVLGGVKKGENALTETTDYTVSGNTITLTDAYKAVVAPTDIKLINHITYDDATTEDKDVNVTLTENGDFFEGTATIGTTVYTVKVPVDNSTPLLTISATSGSISLNSYTPTGTATVTLTGANLANGTFTAPTAEGVIVTPATVEITDGTLNQEFTITTTASTAASTVLSFAYTGAETQAYTLSYSKTAKRELTQTDVTEATTWDWAKSGGASIELTADTDPANGAEFLLAALPEITNDETFNSQALEVACQWPNRGSNYYFQGNTVKFNVTVPGTVQVWFSNTSNRDDNATNRRYLYVNGTNSNVYTLKQTFETIEPMAVPAGEVVINAFTGENNATMIRINKIVFTPATTVTLNANGYATYSNSYDVEVSGAKAYTATLDTEAETITCTEIADAKVPAGAGVLLFGEASAEVTLTPTTGVAALEGNDLKGTTLADGTTATKGNNTYYALSGDTFMQYAGETFAPNKAYFETTAGLSRSLKIAFNHTTGINLVEATTAADGIYDLQGRRVAMPTKGLYILNGKKVIFK